MSTKSQSFQGWFLTLLAGAFITSGKTENSDSARLADIAAQVANVMRQSPNGKAGLRFLHARGVVCQGRFTPSADAREISRAEHFRSGSGMHTVANSHNGFIVGTPEELLVLQRAQAHPWPIESFLSEHPVAQAFVRSLSQAPVSYATEFFSANNAFFFVNEKGERRAGRYQLAPVAGALYLDEASAQRAAPA